MLSYHVRNQKYNCSKRPHSKMEWKASDQVEGQNTTSLNTYIIWVWGQQNTFLQSVLVAGKVGLKVELPHYNIGKVFWGEGFHLANRPLVKQIWNWSILMPWSITSITLTLTYSCPDCQAENMHGAICCANTGNEYCTVPVLSSGGQMKRIPKAKALCCWKSSTIPFDLNALPRLMCP